VPPSPLGRHALADLHGCDPAMLDDVAGLRTAMLHAAERCGAQVVGEQFHRYTPQGVTGALLLMESHFAVHTWPEHRLAAVDLFTCGAADPEAGIEALATALSASRVESRTIARALR
jgi:S-adenosylmethionine decarboxylase